MKCVTVEVSDETIPGRRSVSHPGSRCSIREQTQQGAETASGVWSCHAGRTKHSGQHPEGTPGKSRVCDCYPSVRKLAFGVGASYGRGAMVCRRGEKFNGSWGAPAMYTLEGGSVGFQIGGEATDLILLVMNDRGMESILSSKVKLGADASVAAGPKGRDASADTDANMRADILSYSRSRGVFAGISLEGSTLRPDDEASEQIYGHAIKAKQIVRSERMGVPSTGRHRVNTLQKSAPHNESERASTK